MTPFATLLDRLSYAPARSTKLALIEAYLRNTPDPDRGWAMAVLTDGMRVPFAVRPVLRDLMAERMDAELYRLSRDYVGDTAETVALLWEARATEGPPPRLAEVVERLKTTSAREAGGVLAGWLDRLDATGRWALLKLLTGAPRVGVSARLAKTALAGLGGREVAEVEEVWHGLEPPYRALLAWLEGRGPRPEPGEATIFRPMMLAHPLEDGELATLDPGDFLAEWKWDGIRVQAVVAGGRTRLYSRTGDDVSGAFPDVALALAETRATDAALDGELLVMREGRIAPFNDLQQRLNRKQVTRRLIEAHPAHVRLYDALWLDGEDLRQRPLALRRARLEDWHARVRPDRTSLSELVAFGSWEALAERWRAARGAGIEGLMLKRRTSPYLAGRTKGHWYKWKRAALTADCVLMYAQRGSGKRSSLYSDYTFGSWTGSGSPGELVPVGKAYSGFTDAELAELDRWIRANTTERFGPVRAVRPGLVLEVAFDAVQRSGRHKSGLAMRFPRIHRIRWDKPAAEADRLETLMALIER